MGLGGEGIRRDGARALDDRVLSTSRIVGDLGGDGSIAFDASEAGGCLTLVPAEEAMMNVVGI